MNCVTSQPFCVFRNARKTQSRLWDMRDSEDPSVCICCPSTRAGRTATTQSVPLPPPACGRHVMQRHGLVLALSLGFNGEFHDRSIPWIFGAMGASDTHVNTPTAPLYGSWVPHLVTDRGLNFGTNDAWNVAIGGARARPSSRRTSVRGDHRHTVRAGGRAVAQDEDGERKRHHCPRGTILVSNTGPRGTGNPRSRVRRGPYGPEIGPPPCKMTAEDHDVRLARRRRARNATRN